MKKGLKLIVASFLLAACGASVSVTSDHDQSYNFANIKTAEYWGWADGTDKLMSPFDKERVEKAFKAEFESRNIKLVEQCKGDVILSLHIVTEQKTETTATTTTTGMGYGGYYGYGPGYGWGGGYSTTDYNTYNYTVGTLLVSMYDAKEKRLVWESAGSGTIEKDANNRDERIDYAVKMIMAKYPVKVPTTK